MTRSISPVYEIYLYDAVSVTESFILGEAQLNLASLGTTTTSSKPIALLEGWSLLAYTKRINKPDNHQIRFDLSPDDPMVSTLRELVGVDTLVYIWRTNPLTDERVMVYSGMNRTVVDQARITGSLIITLYGSGPTHLLKRRIVLPDTGEETSQKDGIAEDIMKEFVDEQCANPTDLDRVTSGLVIEQDLGLTGDGDYSANRTNLFTVLERIADQGNVDFKIVPYRKGLKTTVGTEEATAIPMGFSGTYGANTVIGNPSLKFGADKFIPYFDNTAFSIDIYSDLLSDLFDKDKGSVSLWFKVATGAEWTDGTIDIYFQLFADANNNIMIRKQGGWNTVAGIYEANGTVKNVTYNVKDVSGKNDWIHLIFTWDTANDEIELYFNGASVGTNNALGVWAGDLSDNPTRQRIAGTNPFLTNLANGYVAEVALWNDVLTPAEALALYNNPLTQRKQILTTQADKQIAYWPLNDSDETFIPGVFEYRVRKPWGRPAYVGNGSGELPFVFDLFLGNMEIPILSTNSAKEINYLYLLGAGQAPNQLEAEISDAGRIAKSPWNRIELSKTFSRAITTGELEAEGARLLKEREAFQRFTFNVRQTVGYSWPDAWDLGDLITARYFDSDFVKQITEVDVLVTGGGLGADAQTEVITAEMDNYTTEWLVGITGLSELGESTYV